MSLRDSESRDISSLPGRNTGYTTITWALVISIVVVISGYVLASLAHDGNVYISGVPVFQVGSGKFQEGAMEYVEALFWFVAFVLYLGYFKYSLNSSKPKAIWAFCFALLCFFALGEELSWGQHIFGFDTPSAINEINAQRELNLHNINVAKILGLAEGSYWEQRLGNVTKLLNPIFYMVCITAWIIVPFILTKVPHWRNAWVVTYPKFGWITICFLSANVLAFATLDQFFFDVGEVFELALPLTAWLSVLEVRGFEQSMRASAS